MPPSLLTRLKQFDAYYKTAEDFRIRTWGGALGNFIAIFK